jgi:thymidylate kinase
MSQAEIPVPPTIFFAGIDGSGKTALAEMLTDELRKQGYHVRYLWMRYNHYLTKPLLGLCRILRLTRYRDVAGYRIGEHLFYKSKIISFLFVTLTFLDTVLATLVRLRLLRGRDNTVVVCDRYIVDILVDLMIDTKDTDIFKSHWGKAFKKLLPKENVTFYIRRPLKVVLEARPELKYDPSANQRISLYENLVGYWEIHTIDNTGTLQDAHDQILAHLGST